jgi:hypothetical protein
LAAEEAVGKGGREIVFPPFLWLPSGFIVEGGFELLGFQIMVAVGGRARGFVASV